MSRGEDTAPCFGLRAWFGKALPGIVILLPTSVSAAPLSLTGTRVTLLWPALLGIALLSTSLFALTLWLRLRSETADSEQRAATMKDENNKIYRQLQSYGSELAARERQIAEAREQLKKQQQEKSDLLAITGHHLRQPLSALEGTLSLLARSGDGDAAELIETAQRQLKTAKTSLEEIQRFGGMETVELTLPEKKQQRRENGLSILLLENENQVSLRDDLVAQGHQVVWENNGVDGADAALQQKFDLILIDRQLPLMDGIETAQKIRRGVGPELPIFALVSDPRAGDRERYQARGLTGVLARPVAEKQLRQLLDWVTRRANGSAAAKKPARPTRLVNTNTLSRQRDTIGHLPFAELLSDRCATLPKRTTALTSALTGRHWLDAEQQAQAIAESAEEIGLEAVAARLRALAARLSIDSEREYCRHQRTELLNLMRESVRQLKAWREQNVHTEWALK
ncbi:His Kinase A (phospho-acceptor) domain-containing protein [Microbulbifer donghaiensis]|uniref:histidine kinase n=2 Tax=Microbulbifer donghaiensis TaxID=494016 RepID=A0A1M5E511_9GAMM|nr:His Kinase A (phospho-acceptor) domain-containing protein [Microbulbifer donghaiensis]